MPMCEPGRKRNGGFGAASRKFRHRVWLDASAAIDPSQTLDDPASALDSGHFVMTAAVHAMARSGLRGYGRHFPLSHPTKKFVDIIDWTCGMSVRLKLNHRSPEDCDHEALHARPIDAARVKEAS